MTRIPASLFCLLLGTALGAQAQAAAITKDQIQARYKYDMSLCEDHEGEHRQLCEKKAAAERDMMLERIDESEDARQREERQQEQDKARPEPGERGG